MKYHFLDGFPVYVFFALLRGKPVNEGDKLHDQTQLRMVSCDIRMQIHAEDAVFFIHRCLFAGNPLMVNLVAIFFPVSKRGRVG